MSHVHGLWYNEENGRPLSNGRKPSKRYGRLFKSPKTGLNEMLLHHKMEVAEWIDTRIRTRNSSEEPEDVGEAGMQKE